ncbi:MAG TPA: histidine phosphatase family protein [Solirubrobacteraceae bacterium]|nr:histidine phosphatase family protein [Solirubrobacteraceae bacterium]
MGTGTPASGIYLARHGRTAYNEEGRFQGRQPVPLDAVGVEQAYELAESAASYGFQVMYASTLFRAAQTAAIVGERLRLEPIPDERLVETDAGDWTDRLFSDVRAEAPELFDMFAAGDPAFAFPGGESFAHQEVRVLAALAEIETGPTPALVVCHGMVIRAALHGRFGRPEHYGRPQNGALIPFDASAVSLGPDAATPSS